MFFGDNMNLASFLSLIVPGLGQVYNRHYIKGLMFFSIPFILWNVAYIFHPYVYVMGRGLFHEYLFATILCFIIRLWSAFDAQKSAEFYSEDFKLDYFKSNSLKDILLNKKFLIIVLFFICLIYGFNTTLNTDFNTEYGSSRWEATANIVANDSRYELTSYKAAVRDNIFYAETESRTGYSGNWGGGSNAQFNYSLYYKINLSDIDWNINLTNPNNKNLNENMIKENITNTLIQNFENGTLESTKNITVKDSILICNQSFSTVEPINITGENYVIKFEFDVPINDDETGKIELNITIPAENLNIYDPHVNTNSTHIPESNIPSERINTTYAKQVY